MKLFYQLLANTLAANVTNTFVWFAATFWAYLQTRSVLATSTMAGIYLIATALSGFWFGSIVDHNTKKSAMLMSSFATLTLYAIGLAVYLFSPESALTTVASPNYWLILLVLLLGAIAGNIRNIAMPTLVTLIVEEDRRDRANGLVGTVTGVAFATSSVASGLVLAFGGMTAVLIAGLGVTALAILHLLLASFPEEHPVAANEQHRNIDIRAHI